MESPGCREYDIRPQYKKLKRPFLLSQNYSIHTNCNKIFRHCSGIFRVFGGYLEHFSRNSGNKLRPLFEIFVSKPTNV